MKKLAINLIFASTFLLAGSIFADHEGGNRALSRAINQLEYVVTYSTLNYNVKNSVNYFVNDARNYLYYCANGGFSIMDHNGNRRCGRYRQNMQWRFQIVSNYLYDTHYDYPQVYSVWRAVRKLMRQL